MPVRNKGFTLVELLVVISIIAILSVVGVTIYSGITKSAKDSNRRSDIEAISKAYETKYTGAYGDLTPTNNVNLFASGVFPKDPKGGDYTIVVNGTSANAQGFRICAALESNATPACSTPSSTCICKSSTQGDPPDISGVSTGTVTLTNSGQPGVGYSIPTSQLQLWLKADAINSSSGSVVTSWPDASASNTAVAILGSPTKQSGPNGKSVIRFLALTGSPGQNFRVTKNFPAPFSVIYVARMINGNSRILSSLANNWLLGWWGGEMKAAYFEGWVSRGPGTDTNFHLFTGIGNGSDSCFYENGFQFACSSGGTQGPNGLTIGANGASELSDTDIAEIIVYSQALSDTDRKSVEGYLGSKYGIPISN